MTRENYVLAIKKRMATIASSTAPNTPRVGGGASPVMPPDGTRGPICFADWNEFRASGPSQSGSLRDGYLERC